MTTTTIPNRYGVTVSSGVSTKGHDWVVVAILWSTDRTAQRKKRWVRYETEAEADKQAEKLRNASWSDIESWYEAVPV